MSTNFNEAKKLFEIISMLFKERYMALTYEGRKKLREDMIKFWNEMYGSIDGQDSTFVTPYEYIYEKSNKFLCTLVQEKKYEIIDKIVLTGNNLSIKKTRACGITTILLAYVLWHCKNISPVDEYNEIMYFGHTNMAAKEYLKKFIELLQQERNFNWKCDSYDSININGWVVRFKSINTKKEFNLKKCQFIVIDDARWPKITVDEVNYVYQICKDKNYKYRIIEAYTQEGDEINEGNGIYGRVALNNDLTFVDVKWYHDLKKCENLRFERTWHGNKVNRLYVKDEDVASVVSDEGYLENVLLNSGFTLNSDWVERWKKLTKDSEQKKDGEDLCEEFCSREYDKITAISECMYDFLKGIDEVDEETYSDLYNVFENCKTKEEVQKVCDGLKRIKKLYGKKNDFMPFLKLLFDVYNA